MYHNHDDIYLSRMEAALEEKLKIMDFIPQESRDVLDVGCANGAITKIMAHRLAKMNFLGIDIRESFIRAAKKDTSLPNLDFRYSYLRELLAEKKRYDVVIFLSVLHEFYSYGEGISSVVKALSDAHEILNISGRVIIRDMILPKYLKTSDLNAINIGKKIKKNSKKRLIKSFEKKYGKLDNLFNINHYLLKYLYEDNWKSELNENYTAVTSEEYETIFELLDMDVLFELSYKIDYLRNKWKEDFGLTDLEIAPLKSTTILVAQK